jgi:hypothetical protein
MRRTRHYPIFLPVILSFLILTTMLGSVAMAQTTRYADSWGDPGLTLSRQNSASLELNYSMNQWVLGNVEVDGKSLRTVELPGVFLPNETGAPNLPGMGQYIAVPEGAEVSIRVLDYRTELVTDIDLAPAPRIPLDTEDGPLDYPRNAEIFGTNAYYPAEPAIIAKLSEVRGVSATMLGLTPFQYNPVKQELLIYRDIKLEITFTGGNGKFGDDRLRSRWFDPILEDIFINAASLPVVGQPMAKGNRTPDFEYVIITPDNVEFIAWADSLRDFRTEQGITTGVFTVNEVGGNTVTAIESFINDAYHTWDVPPVAVLLLGDYDTGTGGVISPIYDSYCVSDNIFADVTNNQLPDIIFARMTAQNAGHLETFVGKALDYERNPPVDPSFYANPIIAGGWQTERWFVLCDEVLYGFLANNHGKTPIREYAIYDGSPTTWSTATNTAQVLSYFGSAGLGYLPDTPDHLTDWGGNAARLNADINAGSFMLQHRDHGGELGWGEPSYSNSDLLGLTNENLPFVFSINCLTGKYNYSSECFAEAFHRHNQGALGLIAASEISYSFVNDTYVWGMFDYMWPDFDPGHGVAGPHKMLPAFANVSGKYYLEASAWPYNTNNKEVTYHLFHHHGDAFTSVYSEVPMDLTIAHNDALLSGVNFFNITVDEGALVGLTVGGELIASVVGSGGEISIPIDAQLPGQDLIVTVTKQNYFRYRAVVAIIPPAGAFVIHDAHVINDSAGNGDGYLDYAESATLGMTFHNVGLEVSSGAVAQISTANVFVTITDDNESLGDIGADGFVTLVDAFAISLDSSVSDGEVLRFDVVVTDADSTYTSGFSIVARAPNLVLVEAVVDDGADGILDPGESSDLLVYVRNDGASAVQDLMMTLTSLNSYVQITTPPVALPLMGPGETVSGHFYASAHNDTPIGEVAEIDVAVAGPLYSFGSQFALSIGLTIEDFENGNFLGFPWELSGDAGWLIIGDDTFEGSFAARSGVVTDNEATTLSVEAEIVAPGILTFMYQVSSEASYDFLRFAVDGVEYGAWSGTVGWTEASFAITSGWHVFTWSYTKDGSVAGGSDAGWVDYIVFPPVAEPVWPELGVSPSIIELAVDKPESVTRSVVLNNTGDGDLEYEVALYVGPCNNEKSEPLLLKKGEVDPRSGVSPDKGAGGPDAFGYTWIDSDDANGPVYSWVEINGLGTPAGSGDDANLGPFDLGFDFSYYGQTYDQLRVCTNGWVSFTSTNTGYSNQIIPSAAEPNNLLAMLWDDLNPNDGGTIYYYADTVYNRFIVEYDGVPHYSTGNPETFQVIISSDGSIIYQYKTVGAGTGCTVGIENGTGDMGLQVAFNTTYLHDGLAILMASEPLPEPWMSMDSLAGTVAAGSSTALRVTFNTVDAEIGDYEGTISIASNDPMQPLVVVPVTLHVTPGTSGAEDGLPTRFALDRNFPNPFNPMTKINYSVAQTGKVSLHVYDLAGRLVRTLVEEKVERGHHTAIWDGTDNMGKTVASGSYYYRLSASEFTQNRKMVLLK